MKVGIAVNSIEVLKIATLVLAFVGYVWFLARAMIATVLATAGIAFYVARDVPIDGTTAVYWAAAGAMFLVAFFAARFMRASAAIDAPRPVRPRNGQKEVIIDGTNVLFWDGDADLATLRCVVDYLRGKEVHPYVFLDASSRHHLKDKSLNKSGFAKALGMKKGRVMVCPAQSEADEFILKFAKDQGLPIISNDRFGDRAAQAKGIKMIKGIIARGKPVLQGL